MALILWCLPGMAAADTTMPENLRGIFAVPSCENAESIYGTLAGAELYVDTVDGGAGLSIFTDIFARDGWTVIVPDDPSSFWLMRPASEGTVEVAFPTWPTESERLENPELGDPNPYDFDIANVEIEPDPSVPCETLPPAVSAIHGEGYAFLSALDAIALDCGSRGDCLERLFDAFDVSDDGRLNHAEIARAVRIGAYLSVFGPDFFYDTEDFAGAVGVGTLVGPVASELIMRNFDYNGDEMVSLDELLLDRPGLRAADFPLSMTVLLEDDEVGDTVREAIDDLGRALP